MKSIRIVSALALGVLSGCTVGPDYVRPKPEVPAAYKEGFAWQPAQPRDHLGRGEWWAAFADPQLDQLLAQVNVSNQTLVAAEAQFRQAVALADSARAAWYPTATAGLSETRSRPSGTTGPVVGVATTKRTIWSMPLNASWEADLWGKVRRSVEAGEAAAQASAADLENARLSIRSQLAQNYFQLRAVDAQKQLLADTVAAYAKSLELTNNRYKVGVVARVDVAQAEAQLKSTQAQLLDLGVQRAQLEHAIAVLLGRPAGNFSLAAAPLRATPPPVPAGLPADLLERRPDIAAAERRVAAANAQIGVAKAAWFPTATLSASYGFQTATAAQWFTLPSRFWSIGPALAETLFDGGRRQAASDQALAAYDASVANYRQAVLTGFQEVEDNLAALRILEEESQVQAEAVKAAQQSLEYSLNQYKAGIVTYLQVVTAQATALSTQRTAADLLARRVTATVLLVKALGGGWDAASLPDAGKLTNR
ncbi:MAG: efflux transporter outer membrane subunit [Proteobacteria bacterium]|nr:efflux transporter outer membrane subunit [Pseudomonadota bacterium]